MREDSWLLKCRFQKSPACCTKNVNTDMTLYCANGGGGGGAAAADDDDDDIYVAVVVVGCLAIVCCLVFVIY